MKYIFIALAFSNATILFACEGPYLEIHSAHSAAIIQNNKYIIDKLTPNPFTLDLTKVREIILLQPLEDPSKPEIYQAYMNDGSRVIYVFLHDGPSLGDLRAAKYIPQYDTNKMLKFVEGSLKDFRLLKNEYIKQEKLKQMPGYIKKQSNY